MRLSGSLFPSFLFLCAASISAAASSWGFEDGTVSIIGKKAGVGGGLKEKLAQNKALSKPVSVAASETLRIVLTTREDSNAKRPHQAFLNLKDPKSNLETSYAFQVKESGKGKVELSHKDIPSQLLSSPSPLTASVVIASFGTSKPYRSHAFDLSIKLDPSSPLPPQEKPLRYGKLPEIHHIFKSDPTSPPKLITVVFTAAVVITLPILLVTWVSLGANLNHLSQAFGTSPVSHALFFCSICAMEGIFFMYYLSWNLFQTLPAAFGIGLVTFLSGSRALREVQGRRLAGLR